MPSFSFLMWGCLSEAMPAVTALRTALADVRALALVARWRVSPLWSLTGAVARTRQGGFYTRTAVTAGVQRDF